MTLFLIDAAFGKIPLPAPVSFRGTVYYNAIGKFSLTIGLRSVDDALKKYLFAPNACIYDADTKLCWISSQIVIDDDADTVTVNGVTANAVLNSRCIRNNGDVGKDELLNPFYITDVNSIIDMLTVLDRYNGWNNITYGQAPGLTGTVPEMYLHGGQVLDKIMPILDTMGYGNLATIDPDAASPQIKFRIFNGSDLTAGDTPVVFSDFLGNASNFKLTIDGSMTTTRLIVPVKRSDGTKIYEADLLDLNIFDIPVGAGAWAVSPLEMWSAKSIDDTRDMMYLKDLDKQVKDMAAEAFRLYSGRTTLTCQVDPAGFGSRFGLGDIVGIVYSRANVETSARISGVQLEYDKNTDRMTLLLGESPLSIQDKIRYG